LQAKNQDKGLKSHIGAKWANRWSQVWCECGQH